MQWFLFLSQVTFVVAAAWACEDPILAFCVSWRKNTDNGIRRAWWLQQRRRNRAGPLALKKQTPIERLQSEGYDIPKRRPVDKIDSVDFPTKQEVIGQFKADGIDLKPESSPTFSLRIDEEVASASELSDILEQLKPGTNPLLTMQAKMKMKQIETMQTLRDAQKTAERTTDEVLMIPYRIVETYETTKRKAQDTIHTIQATPDVLQGKVNDFFNDVENTTRNISATIQNIQAIPSKVDKTVKDIQAIPGNIQASVDETKQKIDATKKTIDNTVTGVVNLGKFITSSTQTAFQAGNTLIQKARGSTPEKSRTISLDDEVEAALKLAEEAIQEASKESKS